MIHHHCFLEAMIDHNGNMNGSIHISQQTEHAAGTYSIRMLEIAVIQHLGSKHKTILLTCPCARAAHPMDDDPISLRYFSPLMHMSLVGLCALLATLLKEEARV